MELQLLSKNLDNNNGGEGLAILVPGFKGNPECPTEAQIFIEYYEGKVRVHVWNGDNDPITTELDPVSYHTPCDECVSRQLLIDNDNEECENNDDLTNEEIQQYDQEITELEEEINNCTCNK